MVVAVELVITADLENLTNLQPQGPNFSYYFKVQCTNCGETSKKESYVMLSETVTDGRDITHLIQRCKFCSRVGTITMLSGRSRPLMFATAQYGKYAPLMTFDCSGLEPVDFSFEGLWKAESTTGTIFEDIDLSQGEFEDVCDVGHVPVSVTNLRSKVNVVTDWLCCYRYDLSGSGTRYLWNDF